MGGGRWGWWGVSKPRFRPNCTVHLRFAAHEPRRNRRDLKGAGLKRGRTTAVRPAIRDDNELVPYHALMRGAAVRAHSGSLRGLGTWPG